MSNWQKVRLGEVISILGGGTPKTTRNDFWGGSIPWLSVKDFNGYEKYVYSTEKTITELGLSNSSTQLLDENDIIISARGTVGELAMIPYPMAFNQSCYGLRAKNNTMTQFFLYYLLRYNVKCIKMNTHGSVFDTITRETFNNIEINLPPLSDQQRISGILGALDDKIECNNRINRNLEAQAQALFRRWFVDFEFPDPDPTSPTYGKSYRSSGGTLTDSPLGPIPTTWTVGTLGDYCRVRSGFAFKSSWWTEKGIKVLKIKNINYDNTLNLNDCSFVSENKISVAKDFAVQDGDLLIAMTGATIGKFAIVVNNNDILLVNQRVGKFFLGDKPILKLPFIYNLLKQKEVSEAIIGKGQGSAQPNISSNDIESVEIPYPDRLLIDLYNKTCVPMIESIVRNQKENQTLAGLRDSLLPKLMNNEI